MSNVKNVNDIFRRINMINDMSTKAQEEDAARADVIVRKLVQTADGLKEVENSTDKKDFMTFAKEAIGQVKYEVKFKKLDERAVIPTYAHDGDVGMDMTAIDVEYRADIDCYLYHTGLAFETDKHYGIFLFPRSSNRKTEAYLCNHVGIADSAIYRGEIIFCYKNRTSLETRAEMERSRRFFNDISYRSFTVTSGNNIEFTWADSAKNAQSALDWVYNNPMAFSPYKVGDRIGQMVVIPYPNVKISVVDNLSDTERGENGFGSTGN